MVSLPFTKSRDEAAREVYSSPRFASQVEALALKLGEPAQKVRAEAEKGLREIASVQSRAYCYAFDNILGPMHFNAWSVDVKADEVARIAELNRKSPLVFLPTHRSYADAFILTRVLREGGLPRNHILGGNNTDFFPLGTIIKNSGGVLIRRSFRDDEIYKLVVREYLGHLVNSGSNLEWYMEGGRSRTGKLRPPRYGLLRYLVRALEAAGGATDLQLVPVSMTYDQLHEITTMAEEEAGIRGKAPEGVRWLAQYARAQQEWIGNVYVRFGEPFSLRAALAGSHDDNASPWAVEKVAFEVFQRINQVTPVTAPALVTLALLAAHGRALSLAEVTRQIQPLLAYGGQRGLPMVAVDKLSDESGVREVLERLEDARVLDCYAGGQAPVYLIEAGKHGVAAFYRNTAIHWFVNRAILEVALLSVVAATGDDAEQRAWQAAFDLRDLLKFEFFFSDKERFREEIKAESRILSPDFRQAATSPEGRRDLLTNAPFLVAHRVLTQFLEAYFLLADRLAAWDASKPVDKNVLLDQCTRVGHQYVLQQRLSNPESVSRELCGNAFQLAANRGLIEQGPDLSVRRQAFAREVSQAVQAVADIASLDASVRQTGAD